MVGEEHEPVQMRELVRLGSDELAALLDELVRAVELEADPLGGTTEVRTEEQVELFRALAGAIQLEEAFGTADSVLKLDSELEHQHSTASNDRLSELGVDVVVGILNSRQEPSVGVVGAGLLKEDCGALGTFFPPVRDG